LHSSDCTFIIKRNKTVRKRRINKDSEKKWKKPLKALEDEPRNSPLPPQQQRAGSPEGKLNQPIQIFDSMDLSNSQEFPGYSGKCLYVPHQEVFRRRRPEGGKFYSLTQIKEVMVRLIKPPRKPDHL